MDVPIQDRIEWNLEKFREEFGDIPDKGRMELLVPRQARGHVLMSRSA